MKKLLFLFPVVFLLVAGCSFSKQENAQPLKQEQNIPSQPAASKSENIASATPESQGQQLAASIENVICNESPKYLIVSRKLVDSPGSDILVKYKTAEEQNIPCDYKIEKTDFEIKNESAEYFFGLTDDFLVLDSGTAPYPRGLIVYDLINRKKIYTDKYSQPATVKNGVITYWSPTDKKVDDKNCPEYAKYTSEGLGVEIEAHINLGLGNLNKKDTGEYRCSPTQ
jgi:hypothetical protein